MGVNHICWELAILLFSLLALDMDGSVGRRMAWWETPASGKHELAKIQDHLQREALPHVPRHRTPAVWVAAAFGHCSRDSGARAPL